MSGEQLQLGGWAPRLDPALSQWHTPDWLAQKMVAWAGVRPGMHVLEPSAGGGAIVRPLLAAGARVTAVEIDPAWAELLVKEFPGTTVVQDDFLRLPREWGRFDLAVMNPPLDGGMGPAHIAKALEHAPRAVSVIRAVDPHGVARFQTLWRWAALAGVAYCIRRPEFGGPGAQEDFVVVDVWREHPVTPRRPEWW